jgi:phage N-6-adenine-methyltransferase
MKTNPDFIKSKSVEWETPQDFFDTLDKEFGFTLDVCATPQNAKCDRFFTKEQNGLAQDWSQDVCWCNPPYGKEIKDWMSKAYWESKKGSTVVLLVPSRTDTKWFHDYAIHGEIRFIKGRLKFGGHATGAPFPNMIVIFHDDYSEGLI